MKRIAIIVGVVLAVVAVAVTISVATREKPPASTASNGNSSGQSSGDASNSFTASVSITDKGFVPSGLTVKKGTTVTWTNQDALEHTVSGYGDAGPGSMALGRNETYTFTFTTEGEYGYASTYDAGFNGTVTVTK